MVRRGALAIVVACSMFAVAHKTGKKAAQKTTGASRSVAVPRSAGKGPQEACAEDHGGPRQLARAPCSLARSGGSIAVVRHWPSLQCGQQAMSMPVTRLRKAAASSRACWLDAGMARAKRAADNFWAFTAGLSSP